MFKKLSRKLIYQDPWVTFYLDDIEFPDGSIGTHTVMHRKPGVGIVVTTPTQKMLLQKEYRYVIDSSNWEIPGGGIDEGETPEQAAKRELFEETGIVATELENFGISYPLNSLNNEVVTIFHTVVEEDVLMADHSEHSEFVEDRKFFTFDQVLSMIDSNEIIDANTGHTAQMVIRKLQARTTLE